MTSLTRHDDGVSSTIEDEDSVIGQVTSRINITISLKLQRVGGQLRVTN